MLAKTNEQALESGIELYEDLEKIRKFLYDHGFVIKIWQRLYVGSVELFGTALVKVGIIKTGGRRKLKTQSSFDYLLHEQPRLLCLYVLLYFLISFLLGLFIDFASCNLVHGFGFGDIEEDLCYLFDRCSLFIGEEHCQVLNYYNQTYIRQNASSPF